jgi:hypothetical protein
MDCVLKFCGAATAESLPEKELPAALIGRVRIRQAAALYLKAATMAENAGAREFLRRRAARLISPRPAYRNQRRVC